MIFFLILFAHLHNVQVQKTLLKLLLKMSLLSTKVSGFFSGTFCHWQAIVETQSWEINIILYPEEVAFILKMKKKTITYSTTVNHFYYENVSRDFQFTTRISYSFNNSTMESKDTIWMFTVSSRQLPTPINSNITKKQ